MTEQISLNQIDEIPTFEEIISQEKVNIPKGTIQLYFKLLDQALLELDGNASLPVIFIDGGQLSGKTTLAVHGIDHINRKTGKPLMDLKDTDNVQYAMGGEQFLKKLPEASSQKYRIVVYDEAGDYARKGAMTRFNKVMDKAIDVMRVHKCIIIFICHYFPKQVPSEMMDKGLVSCLLHCISRKPGQSYTSVKVYDKESCAYMVNHWIKLVKVPGHIYRLTPNFMFNFNDIEPERSIQLANLGRTKKKDLWDMAEIRLNGLLTQKEMAQSLNMSVEWVRKKLKDIEGDAEKVYKNKKYYNMSVVEQLRRLI